MFTELLNLVTLACAVWGFCQIALLGVGIGRE
jgi:hypothetical protein